MNQINNLARHTRLLEIAGDTVRVRAGGRAFGEIAVVENTDGESSLATVVDLDHDIVSLQVFSGGKGLSTGATVNFLGPGGTLMDRTIIICNTSSMPVAAREASIYTGITLGEYFRQMGYDVLLIADSTSRWAQAMRETSGRMEEIPGEEAFPAYLDSAIKNLYERAGVIRCADGSTGTLTLIGTVSPAGGNFEEPVTQSTLGTVKTFLGLSADRAYKRFYPAIDPLLSWSRYLDQLAPWFTKELNSEWVNDVKNMMTLLERGDGIYQIMQVTGEEGITLEDFIEWQKSMLLDMVYLQQDAFDEIDACMPRERQLASFGVLKKLVAAEFKFQDKNEARDFFTKLTGLYKNWNYSRPDSPDYERYGKDIEQLADQFQSTLH